MLSLLKRCCLKFRRTYKKIQRHIRILERNLHFNHVLFVPKHRYVNLTFSPELNVTSDGSVLWTSKAEVMISIHVYVQTTHKTCVA